MPTPEFKPGFRISVFDSAVLVAGSIASALVWQKTWWLGFVIAFVVGHFFLFCNVFRISRLLELLWAGVFVLLARGSVISGHPSWTMTIGFSLATTMAVIAFEMKRASYHGICWQQVNPGLFEWWKTQSRQANDTNTD